MTVPSADTPTAVDKIQLPGVFTSFLEVVPSRFGRPTEGVVGFRQLAGERGADNHAAVPIGRQSTAFRTAESPDILHARGFSPNKCSPKATHLVLPYDHRGIGGDSIRVAANAGDSDVLQSTGG